MLALSVPCSLLVPVAVCVADVERMGLGLASVFVRGSWVASYAGLLLLVYRWTPFCAVSGLDFSKKGPSATSAQTFTFFLVPDPAHLCGETRRDKTSGRRTHHPTQAHMWGDKGARAHLGKASTPSNTGTHVGRQGGKGSPREGEHTFQHRRTRAETMGHNVRQGETRLGKADTPSKKGRQEGRCWMVCPPSRGLVSHSLPFSPIVSPHVRLCLDGVCLCLPLSPPHVCLCWVPEALSPLASHCLACSPHMCAWMVCPPSRGRVWQQGEKRPREGRDTPSNKGQQAGTQGEKAETPSNTGTHAGRQ